MGISKYDRKDHSKTGGSKTQKEVTKRGRPPEGESWVWKTVAMLSSPAFLTQSINARKAYDRICLEHAAHGGKANGELRVTYQQFKEVGCSRDLIADAISELEFKGAIRVARGKAADGTPWPNVYTLTHVGTHDGGAPTNEWKSVSSDRCREWDRLVRARKAKERSIKAESIRKIPRSQKHDSADPSSRIKSTNAGGGS